MKPKSTECTTCQDFGIELPVRYEEGKPFNPSIDDLKFTYPDIDPLGCWGLIEKS